MHTLLGRTSERRSGSVERRLSIGPGPINDIVTGLLEYAKHAIIQHCLPFDDGEWERELCTENTKIVECRIESLGETLQPVRRVAVGICLRKIENRRRSTGQTLKWAVGVLQNVDTSRLGAKHALRELE